jgi:hypothetical protein
VLLAGRPLTPSEDKRILTYRQTVGLSDDLLRITRALRSTGESCVDRCQH